MQQPSTFQVYNASAGSGKTFTLVKEYLKVLLDSKDVFSFQKILAITFTNKAAGEMKERVLKNLEDFAAGKENSLLGIIIAETDLEKEVITQRSKKILEAILQNYSAFSITTIDSFTHKIIKNFAYDLGLSLNFEVQMDAVSLLNEAVDVLISKIGTDKQLTNLLIDYSLEKIEDDKSWDISIDLNDFAKILLNEDDVAHFRVLADKTIEDFTALKKKLVIQQKEIVKTLKEIGETGVSIIDEAGLEYKNFYYSLLPKHFLSLAKLPESTKFFDENKTKERIEEGVFYSKSTKATVVATIETILPELVHLYTKSETLFRYFTLNKLTLKSSIPLAVLNHINSELNQLKEENNIRLNAEFNQLISDNIKDQPAPFIYERIGQRFQNYFIDEMQDTSVLQWQNLIPLINNALSQPNSSLLLVGDGKQAIYRWRGGKAEQFINLGDASENGVDPFQIKKEIKELATNYRSYSEVISFNNSFFQHTAKFIQNESYKSIFIEGNKQLENAQKGGFVSLSFLEKEAEKEVEKIKYPKKVLEKINLLRNDFHLNEICVLVRKKKDGIAVANYLTKNGVSIVSSETLLLQNNAKIKFIIAVLKIIQNTNDEEARFDVLYFLYDHLDIKIQQHAFFTQHIKEDNAQLFESLKIAGISFNYNHFQEFPFYEKIEEIIRGFRLVNSSNAYIQFFLDVVLEQQRKATSVTDFLDFWELKKESLSIVASENTEAVQIMTIHKSKGLEFPVVIFPCDLPIYRQIKPKVWLNELPEEYKFKEFLIDYTKNLRIVNKTGLALYNQQREQLELDNFNLLYVALTRPVEQLHIITEKLISAKGEENVTNYSGIFINYLKEQNRWNDSVLEYTFGKQERIIEKPIQTVASETHNSFISNPWQEHNITLLASASKLWNTVQGEAIDFGNLFHEILAKINIGTETEKIVSSYYQQGVLSLEQANYIKKLINQVVSHSVLQPYFSEEVTVFNEREIVTTDNHIIIPDRLVFNTQNEVSILDYKTGTPSKEHHQQLLKYELVLKAMNFKVVKKLLIYINDEVLVEEVK